MMKAIRSSGVAYAGILAVTLLFAGSAVSAWTGPTQAAPNGNTATPINVSASSQVKSGGLWVGSLGADSAIVAPQFCIGSSCITSWTTGQWTTSGTSLYYNSGNVGIGTASPSTRLHIGDGGDGWANGFTIRSNYPTIYLRDVDGRGAMIHNNDNLLFFLSSCATDGNSAAGNNWCSQANSYWPLYLNLNNNDAVFGGNVYAFGYFHNSDARLKKDIVPLRSGLDIVQKLQGVSFVWKANDKSALGVIAQDVEKVLPSAVSEDKDGTKSVEYDQLIAPLIEAIKEQQRQIETLKSEIKTLKVER